MYGGVCVCVCVCVPFSCRSQTDQDQQVGVVPCENGNVHWNTEGVGFIQTNAEVPLSAQQQEDEDADVHEAHAGCTNHIIMNYTDLNDVNMEHMAGVWTHTDLLWNH